VKRVLAHPTLIVALLLTPVGSAQTPAKSLAEQLAEIVDQPTTDGRRAKAAELAGHRELALENLLPALKSFGAFEKLDPGIHRETVALRVGDRTEETELFVFVPRTYDPAKPAPLMLSFHGTGGSGQGMHSLWQKTAEELGMLVLSPSEAGENNGYHFSDRERTAALAALRWMRRRFNVDEDRVFASGISRGGHLTWDLGLRFPDRFAALAPMIGSPRITLTAGQNNLRYMENAAQLPIRDLQGSKDDEGLVFSVRLAFEKLARLGAKDAKLIEFPERGHDFDFSAVNWSEFLGAARRDPRPDGVVRLSANKDEVRAHWLEALAFDKSVDENFMPKISMSDWAALDEANRRKRIVEEAEQRTGRVEAWMRAPGSFEVTARGVTKVRLYLTPEMLDASGGVKVRFGGKVLERKAKLDKKVLLAEFAERFDRSFLPVAVVDVP
jgi:dienelactone hydrolase